MKKLIIGVITSSMAIILFINQSNLRAEDFNGQEEKYTTICASASLSKSDQTICSDFNSFLKEKNTALLQQIEDSKASISQTKNDIDAVVAQINKIKEEIATKESEIAYLNTSIANLQVGIDKKEALIKERMYAMQSYTNNSLYVDFVFGASSFADMFSRIDSVNEITSYDKSLIQGLVDDKANLVIQKKTIDDAKIILEAQQKNQGTLQDQFLALYEKQNKELADQQNASNSLDATSKKIDENLATLYQISKESESNGVLVPGDSQVGNNIASAALSKQGSRYWWGAQGPDYFDCSGLVYWAHNQAGVSLGRTTASRYSSSGASIPYSQLQPGDVITFYNYGYVSHIGIYIGDGKMVHASGVGSSTRGQSPNEKVMVGDVSPGSMFYNLIYNCRRLY